MTIRPIDINIIGNNKGGISGGIPFSFTGIESAVGADVTGLLPSSASIKAFWVELKVEIDATAKKFAFFNLRASKEDGDWSLTSTYDGDDTLVEFDIDTNGQILYDSSTYAGFVSLSMSGKKFEI